jgi:hypothetical protein
MRNIARDPLPTVSSVPTPLATGAVAEPRAYLRKGQLLAKIYRPIDESWSRPKMTVLCLPCQLPWPLVTGRVLYVRNLDAALRQFWPFSSIFRPGSAKSNIPTLSLFRLCLFFAALLKGAAVFMLHIRALV